MYIFFFMGVIFKRFESLDFLKICTFLKNGATQVWDTPQDVPSASQGNEWVGYDNVRSFSIKLKSPSPTSCRSSPEFRERKWHLVSSIVKQTQWLKQNGFGGAMIWAVDLDDFTDTFYNQEKSPLITALKDALGLQSASKWQQEDAQGIQMFLLHLKRQL